MRELEHIRQVHSQRRKQRDEERSSLKEFESSIEKMDAERADLEQNLRNLESALHKQQTEADRYSMALRKADTVARQKRQGVEQLLEQKQVRDCTVCARVRHQ